MGHTKLFFAIEPEISNHDGDLAEERKPKRCRGHRTARNALREIPGADVGEHRTRSDGVRRSRSGHHDTDRTNNLSEDERDTHV